MTEPHKTPEEHSTEVGGSTAARRIGCPDSRILEKKAPKSRGSVYAREGTALHEMMALILGPEQKDPEDLLPFTFNGVDRDGDKILEEWSHTITADTWADVGQPALDMFDEFCDRIESEYDADIQMFIEVRGAFPGIPGAFGTSDVLWRCGLAGGCWDWKFGRTPVSAEDNKQLKFYLNTGIYEKPEFFNGVEDFYLHISQPLVNMDEPSEDVIEMQDLIDFREELQEAMTSRGMAEGPWCKFADCALICPLKTRKTARLGEKMEALQAATKADELDGFDMAEFLAEALELKDAAEQWVKSVAGMAQQMIDEKLMEIPGWKTVEKRSSGREWAVEDAKVRAYLQRNGLKVDDYAPRKTITVTAADKLLKKDGRTLKEDKFRKKPSSGTTLVRDGDPRPAARSHASRAASLAAATEKLAAEN